LVRELGIQPSEVEAMSLTDVVAFLTFLDTLKKDTKELDDEMMGMSAVERKICQSLR
jgi:hypothetical protein